MNAKRRHWRLADNGGWRCFNMRLTTAILDMPAYETTDRDVAEGGVTV